jgi:hypothetical protein
MDLVKRFINKYCTPYAFPCQWMPENSKSYIYSIFTSLDMILSGRLRYNEVNGKE